MQVLGSRRGGLITLAIAAVALIAAVAFAVWQLIERPSVTEPLPGPGQLRLRRDARASPSPSRPTSAWATCGCCWTAAT